MNTMGAMNWDGLRESKTLLLEKLGVDAETVFLLLTANIVLFSNLSYCLSVLAAKGLKFRVKLSYSIPAVSIRILYRV